jgi:hypothetical protein
MNETLVKLLLVDTRRKSDDLRQAISILREATDNF